MSMEAWSKRLTAIGGPQGAGFDPAETEAWSKRVLETPALSSLLEEIRVAGRELAAAPMPDLPWSLFKRVYEDGDRSAYEKPYFNRRKRLTTYGLLAWLEPERADYLDALLDAVWLICDEYTWSLPAHAALKDAPDAPDPSTHVDLFAAETAFAIAELLALTGDRWPAAVRLKAEAEARRRVLDPYRSGRLFGWEKMTNNWTAVCAGSIGAAAVHLVRDAGEWQDIMARVFPSLECFLSGFGEDGACQEGYNYWVYGFGFFTYFADLLRRGTGGAIDLLADGKVGRIAKFQEVSFLGDDKVVNFSDASSHRRVFLGLSHYLHRRYPDMSVPPADLRAPYEEDHAFRWASALRNLIWFDPDLNGEAWKAGSSYLPDAQWLLSRHHAAGAGEALPFGFAAKCGHNGEPHNHNDVGHFLLWADGETYLADLGAGPYSKAYFGEERYTFLCNGSQGHSVPIVDGSYQGAGRERRGQVLEAACGSEADLLEMDLATAYAEAPGLRGLVRRLAWSKPAGGALPALRLTDAYRFAAAPSSLVERLICAIRPEPGLSPGTMVLRGKRLALTLNYDPERWQPSVTPFSFADHYRVESTFYMLDFERLRLTELSESACRFELEMRFESN